MAEAGETVEKPQVDPNAEAVGEVDQPEVPAEDEVVVSIGDPPEQTEEDDNRAPEWVRELRKANREKDRRIRELEQQARANQQPKEQGVQVGEKPSLASCDYDEEAFERELLAWEGRKRQAAEEQRKKEAEAKEQQDAWNETLARHRQNAAELKVSDYQEAEDAARNALSEVQQAIIVSGADNSALVFCAIGKNEAKLKELASIKDPVKFSFAIAKLQTQLKVTTRSKTPPIPEKQIRGSGSFTAGSSDTELERLRDEAQRTGDMSKLLAYKRSKRAA